MYKGASESLQRRHAVDKPHPSKGYIDGGPDPFDLLPDPDELPVAQLRDEQKQLRIELKRCEEELLALKVLRRGTAVAQLGQQKAALQSRLSAVNKAMNAKDGPSESRRLGLALRELIPDDSLVERIFARARELRGPASGIKTEGHDHEDGHGAKHESPVDSKAGETPKGPPQ